MILTMSNKRYSVIVIFCSEYCTDTYFIDSWNPINTEIAQDTIMIIYDVKYGNIRKQNFENFNIL